MEVGKRHGRDGRLTRGGICLFIGYFCGFVFFLFLPHHILHAAVSTATSSLPRGGRGGKLILFVVWSGVFLSSVILKISMLQFRQLDWSLQLEMFHVSSSNPRFGQSLVGHSGFVAQWRCSRQPSLHHARKVRPAQRPDKLCLTQNTTLLPMPRRPPCTTTTPTSPALN